MELVVRVGDDRQQIIARSWLMEQDQVLEVLGKRRSGVVDLGEGGKAPADFVQESPQSVANPAQTDPNLGIGFKELYRYMALFYERAKKYKPECLIIGNAVDPHFGNVQDMISISDDWDNKLRREKRARIINQALPDKLICGDSIDMYNSIAIYHYMTSAIYSVPTIYYFSEFHN